MKRTQVFGLSLFTGLLLFAASRGPALASVTVALDSLRAGTDSDVDLQAPIEVEGFSFVVFGDRTGGPDSGLAILADAVEMTNDLDPDFSMTVGDLVDGYNADADWLRQMGEYKAVMQDLDAPWFPVAGNHDVYARPEKPGGHMPLYKQHFGPLYYSFDYRWAHFVCLFTDESLAFHDPAVNQNFSDEQFEWLRDDLANSSGEQLFVFQHHPRWNYPGTDWSRVHELLAQDEREVTVFAGHTHQYRDDGERDGVRYFTMGRTGAVGDTYDTSASLHHINQVRVRRDRVSMTMLPVGAVFGGDAVTGEELDTMGALRRGRWLGARAEAVMHTDAKGSVTYELSLENPTDRALRWSIEDVGHQAMQPSQLRRGRLKAGESKQVELAGDLPVYRKGRPDVRLEVQLEYELESGLSQTITRSVLAPVRLPEFRGLADQAREDRVLQLDGRSALRVDLPEPLDQLTLECWVRGGAVTGRTALVTKTQNSAFGIFWRDSNRTVPSALVHVRGLPPEGNAGYATASAGEAWAFEEWTHVALSWDAERLRFFVGGELRGDVAAPGPATWNQLPLWIGADPDGGGKATSFFQGELDELRLSSRARYTQPFTPTREAFETDEATELLLHFDVAHEDLHPDSSGHDRHAWAQGAPRLVTTD